MYACEEYIVHIQVHTVQRVTFEGENFRKLVKKTMFTEKTFVDCSLVPRQRTSRPQIPQRKLLQIATKLLNL